MGRDCASERGQRLEHGRLRALRRRRAVGRTPPRRRPERLCVAWRDQEAGTRRDIERAHRKRRPEAA